jgi:outer membrane protein assembly factor BamB
MSTDQLMTRRTLIALVVVLGMVAVVGVRSIVRTLRCRPPAVSMIDDPAQIDDRHLELLELETESWVRRFRPDRSSAGYNLVLYRRRVPLIIDMNGRVVHSWPKVRATGRIRLNRDGSLAVIGVDNLIKEYSWNGDLTWHFQLPDKHDSPHHDLVRTRSGNYLILAHDGHSHTDFLLEVDRDGAVAWEWRFEDHAADFPNWDPDSMDPSHTNSIRELPPNRWHGAGDERFRPGNILLSARSLNTIFIIDKASGDVVWKYSRGLDGQHEAVMFEQDLRRPGHIMVFNNGLENLFEHRRSRVQVVNPVNGELIWEYGSDFFFSSVGGTAQPLPGNSVLVTSSHGGRVFEVKGRGRIVWEWAPPFLPMRAERVAYDHCPQLAGLPVPVESKVIPEDRRPFVDSDLYSFDFKWQTEKKKIDGRVRRLIRSVDGCRDLRVPAGANLRTEFGIDGERLDGRTVEARFLLTIDDHERPLETLIDVRLDENSDPLWTRQTVSIARYALREVTMCIDTSVEGDITESEGIVLWANPQILSAADRERRDARSQRISDQERRLREQQLRTLGYVD